MEKDKTELAIITKDDLSLIHDNALNELQLQFVLKRTPKQYVKDRPAKGGGTWKFVSGGYIKKCLNLMFGFDWDFEILDEKYIHGQVIVRGKLTCRAGGKTIIKTQYGRKDVICRKGTENPLDIGNDFKAAATDCLKKCASEIGIAADIYNADEFKEVTITSTDDLREQLGELIELKKESLSNTELEQFASVLHNNETWNYKKSIKILKDK